MRRLQFLTLAVVAAAATVFPSGLYAKCFIFVHGHTSYAYNYTDARNYWKKNSQDMAYYIGKNNGYYIAYYNALNYYWDGAVEVAGRINSALAGQADAGGNKCAAGETSFVIVAHSMGNAVMDYIMGNSRSTDPYYNYNGANFKNIADKVTTHVSSQGAHGGSSAAEGVCGNAGWFMNAISGVVGFFIGSTCDKGTESLQPSWTVAQYANSPRTSVYLISGYEAIFGSSALLTGEDDGLLEYGTTFACPNIYTSYSTSNQCTTHQESAGFNNCDQSHENHDDGRNDADRDVRKSVKSTKCWGTTAANTQVRSGMSTAELIRCIWAYKPAGDTACN